MINEGRFLAGLRGLWALTKREVKKWFREPIVLLMVVLQPVLWMALLGKVMRIEALFSINVSDTGISDLTLPGGFVVINPQGVLVDSVTIPGPVLAKALQLLIIDLSSRIMLSAFGTVDYFSYMSIGVISMVVLFTAMFSGMSMVWDRRLGFLNKVLSTPVSRASIIFSKILNAAFRSMFQATIILALAVILGLKVSSTFTPFNLLGVYAAIFLASTGFSSLFLVFALRSTRHETQMALVNLVSMPLMFSSNVFFPVSMMPSWLQPIASINPISYLTDALRELITMPLNQSALALDFAYLGAFALIVLVISVLLSLKYLAK